MVCPVFAAEAGNRHWLAPKEIKTYIPKNHVRTLMMQHAFKRWSKSLNNKVIFQYVDRPQKAQLIVNFVDVIPNNADRKIGLTKARFLKKSGKMEYAEIYIAEQTVDGKKLGDDSVFTVMIHEIGHAIGISEHSKDPKSVMFPFENDIQEIQKADIKAIAEIYGW